MKKKIMTASLIGTLLFCGFSDASSMKRINSHLAISENGIKAQKEVHKTVCSAEQAGCSSEDANDLLIAMGMRYYPSNRSIRKEFQGKLKPIGHSIVHRDILLGLLDQFDKAVLDDGKENKALYAMRDAQREKAQKSVYDFLMHTPHKKKHHAHTRKHKRSDSH